MQFGLLPKDLVTDGELAINLLSDRDDFPPGVRVDPSAILTTWAAGDCTFVHDQPIYNVGVARADTGSVFRLGDAAFSLALPRKPRTRLLAAAAAAGIGGAIAALLWRRRK